MWNRETDTLCIDPVSVDVEVGIAVKVVLCRAILNLLDLDDGAGASARMDWLGNLELTHWRVTGQNLRFSAPRPFPADSPVDPFILPSDL